MLKRFLAGQNPAVGNRIAQKISLKVSLLRDDAEKLVVSFHDKVLHEIALFRRNWPGTIEHVLEFAAFENHGSKPNLVK